jgi:hypothetical protein
MLNFFYKLFQSVGTIPSAPITKNPTIPVITPANFRIPVVIINQSTVIQDSEIQPVITALQIQLDRDFTPVWGISAELSFCDKNTTPPTNAWQLLILDDSDQAGALGYHELTPEGLPISRVFAKSDLQYHLSWSVTISHELIEMFGDPDINLTTFVQDSNTTGTLLAYELCDACEDDVFGYLINGVLVSDFVYPAWFESFRTPGSTQFDHMNKITAPFQLLPGGYIGVFTVGAGSSGWSQKTAQAHLGRRAAAKGQYSRFNRRKK